MRRLLEDGIFTRGAYEDEELEGMTDLRQLQYLVWLVEESDTDDETKATVEAYIEDRYNGVESLSKSIQQKEEQLDDPYGWKNSDDEGFW